MDRIMLDGLEWKIRRDSENWLNSFAESASVSFLFLSNWVFWSSHEIRIDTQIIYSQKKKTRACYYVNMYAIELDSKWIIYKCKSNVLEHRVRSRIIAENMNKE